MQKESESVSVIVGVGLFIRPFGTILCTQPSSVTTAPFNPVSLSPVAYPVRPTSGSGSHLIKM